MNKILLFLINCTFSFALVAQTWGVNYDVGINNQYNQKTEVLTVDGDFTYVLISESISNSYFTNCSLLKLDTTGTTLWSLPISPSTSEFTTMKEMVVSESGSIYVLGWATEVCDVMENSNHFIQKINPNGFSEWSLVFSEPNWNANNFRGMRWTESNHLVISWLDQINHPNATNLLSIDANGAILDTLYINEPWLLAGDDFGSFAKIGFSSTTLKGFDGFGNSIAEYTTSSEITDVRVNNDTCYVITVDSILLFDTQLQPLISASIPGYSNFRQLQIYPDGLDFWSEMGNSLQLMRLSHDLQVQSIETTPFVVYTDGKWSAGKNHVSIAFNHDLTAYESIRLMDFSRVDSTNGINHETNIGAVNVDPTLITVTPDQVPMVYTIEMDASVLVKNYGTKPLNSCRINHVISTNGICNGIVYSQWFSGLNVQPNDSIWIACDFIHQEQVVSSSDTLLKQICVYTSHPNGSTDLVVSDDEYCKDVLISFVGLNEWTLPKAVLVRIVDVMGRPIGAVPNQVLLYEYSDGSVKKQMILE